MRDYPTLHEDRN